MKDARIRSTGVVITRPVSGIVHYLLLRAFNYWDFPKGEVAPGEHPLHTAKREAREETTLDDLNFRWGNQYCETPVYGKGKVARYYIAEKRKGEVRLPVTPELGRPEHHEFRWLDYAGAYQVLVPRLQAVLRWAHDIVNNQD